MSDTKYPYDFVPFPLDEPDTAPPPGHDNFTGISGSLNCTLTALTPLLVKGSDTGTGGQRTPYYHVEEQHTPVIPGTSLKGMVRSVFEVLTNSCVGFAAEGKRLIPKSHEKCKERSALCPACRTFGYMEGGRPHKGLVNVGQAKLQNDASPLSPAIHLPELHGPNVTLEKGGKPVLNKKYYGSQEDPNGRKFYLHHRAYDDCFPNVSEEQKRDYVEPLEEGAVFTFEVTFENLNSYLLSALVAALTLSDGAKTGEGRVTVRHKLGYGKPAGLGSVNIEIKRARIDSTSEGRYQQFHVSPEVKTGDELNAWVEGKQNRFFASSRSYRQALARVLRWPPDPEVDVTYDASPPQSG